MALGQLEAVEQLRQELNGGQELSARLWELISHPLDSGGREAALEMIKQISRVFMVSLFMLKPGDSSRVGEARMVAPEVTTERSIRRRSLTKDKRIWYTTHAPSLVLVLSWHVVASFLGDSVIIILLFPVESSSGSEDVTPPRNGRQDITASPFKDACLWRKYGQKNIHDRIFPR